ncbi:TPA: type VI secretion system lipoprotein TssJ [Pseudomonas putida]|nr:type VI secretion system lipoprotein TssJ [Pseudomonas putida]
MKTPIGLLLIGLVLSGCTSISRMYQVAVDPTLPIGGPNNDISRVALSLYAADLPALTNPLQSTLGAPAPALDHSVQLSANLSGKNAIELTDKLSSLAEQLHQHYPPSAEEDQASSQRKEPAALASYAATGPGLSSEPDLPQRQAPSPIAFKVLQLRDDSLLLDTTHEQLEADMDKALGTTLISVDDYRLMPGHFKFIEHEEINERTRYIAVIARLSDKPRGNWKDAVRIQPRGFNHTVHVHFENNGVELRHDSEYRRDQ